MPASAPSRAAPFARPIAATIAVVPRDGALLLVRRANPPDAGRWGFPGGKIETGEALLDAAIRELHEETQVEAEAVEVLTAVDALDHDETGALRQHFILIAVLCRWRAGEPVAGGDALEARWIAVEALEREDLALSIGVAALARRALARAAGLDRDRNDRRRS